MPLSLSLSLCVVVLSVATPTIMLCFVAPVTKNNLYLQLMVKKENGGNGMICGR